MSSKYQYQSPIPTALAIALCLALYLLRIGAWDVELPRLIFEGESSGYRTLLFGWIATFEAQEPIWAITIATVLVVLGALRTMKISTDFNLFSGATHLPAMLYLIPFATFATPDEIIAPALTGFIMTSAMEGLFGGYNHFSGGAKIFRGCFWLGVLPLIYPAMAVLYLLTIGVVLILDRGGRDFVLIFGGVALPLLIYLYVGWLCGVDFYYGFYHLVDVFMSSGWSLAQEWGVPIVAVVLAFFAILSIVRLDEISIALVARTRLTFAALCAVVSMLMIFIPSFTSPQLCVATIPVALTLTAALYELTVRLSVISYLLIIVLMILVRVLP